MPIRSPEAVQALINDHDKLVAIRAHWEGHWQDIRDLVRPSGDEIRRITTPGRVKSQFMYDATAPDACEQLASGLQSFLMSPVERWFLLRVNGMEDTRDHQVLMWLEAVADIIYKQFQSPKSNLANAASELLLDLASYGTANMYAEWNADERRPLFRAYPIRDCWIKENHRGRVDTLHRAVKMTKRQVIQAFGEEKTPKKIRECKDEMRKWDIIHVVRPREDRDVQSFLPTQMPFASYWISRETRDLIIESGFKSFPYMVTRWITLSDDDAYGRSPAMKALPDIKMINAMVKTLIKVGQKAADPPLVVPNDGFLLPLATHPGSLIFKEPGVENIEQLPGGERNLPITREIIMDYRAKIQIAFHADWLRMEKENKEMTAFEVQDRRQEKLMFLAPMLGRQETELLGPLIGRTYSMLLDHGMIPPAPPQLGGRTIKPEYTSPAAKAQESLKALEIDRFVQETIPLAQVDQSVLDNIDFDRLMSEKARYRGVSRMVLRSPEEVEEIRASRQQQEQVAAAAQIAEPATKAMKNLAEAQQAVGR